MDKLRTRLSKPQKKEEYHILVVEPDPFYRNYIQHFLGLVNLEVELVTDSNTALKRISTRIPDLIMIEALLPKAGGLTFCRQVKENKAVSHVPIIVFSALDLKTAAYETGAEVFLSKPFDNKSFSKAISQFLNLEAKESRT